MKYLQNKISDAINRGIKLGIELYDDTILDDGLDKDLEANQILKGFKSINLIQNINRIIDAFLTGNSWPIEILRMLCLRYEEEHYAIYDIENNVLKLHKLIIALCSEFGNHINLNWIDVSHVQRMNFEDPSSGYVGSLGLFLFTTFNGDISAWDVSNVTSMSYMFRHSKFNGDISQWDVSKVKSMDFMFNDSVFNGDLSKWNVSNVVFTGNMFSESVFNNDISQWDTSNMWYMQQMFYNSQFNSDISKWDVSRAEDMSHMFANSKFNQDLSNWNINKNCYNFMMFKDCPILKKYKPIKHRTHRLNEYLK